MKFNPGSRLGSARHGARLRREQKGVAVLEAALWLPILVLLFIVIVDVLLLTTTYLGLTQISREALLTGARSPSILGSQANLNPSLSQYQTCLASPTDGNCAHVIMQWRVRRLIESNHINLAPGTLQIVSSFDSVQNTVRVEVKGRDSGLFGFFRNTTLAGRAIGGYVGL